MPAVIIDVWQCPEYASPFCYTRLRKRKYSLSMIILLDFIYNYFYLFWTFPQNCNFNSFYLNVPLWFSWKVFGFLMFSGGIKWEHRFRDFVKFVKRNFEIFQKNFDAEAATECSANQWTVFYMITASVMKGLKAIKTCKF